MAWRYDISKNGGDELQRMIQASDKSCDKLAGILEQISRCCQEVAKRMEEAIDPASYEFTDLASVIDGEPELCRAKDTATIREWGYTSFVELVDARLSDFYDYCDSHGVWIGIGVPRAEMTDHARQEMGGMSQ